jgi:hypothetical protein
VTAHQPTFDTGYSQHYNFHGRYRDTRNSYGNGAVLEQDPPNYYDYYPDNYNKHLGYHDYHLAYPEERYIPPKERLRRLVRYLDPRRLCPLLLLGIFLLWERILFPLFKTVHDIIVNTGLLVCTFFLFATRLIFPFLSNPPMPPVD